MYSYVCGVHKNDGGGGGGGGLWVGREICAGSLCNDYTPFSMYRFFIVHDNVYVCIYVRVYVHTYMFSLAFLFLSFV